MVECNVTFEPQKKTVAVPEGTTLLDAAVKADVVINSLCGGDGICGRCRMILKEGDVSGNVSPKLTRDEIRDGYVLGCLTQVKGDVVVEIPPDSAGRDKTRTYEDSGRFKAETSTLHRTIYMPSPLVKKIHLELEPPSLANNTADHQRVCEAISRKIETGPMQMGLKTIKSLPGILRENDYKVTATLGMRRDVAEVMQIEGGDTTDQVFMVVVDLGTTTVVAHLTDVNTLSTIDAEACFNSQGVYGREVTGRMISAEKVGVEELQKLIVSDINRLIQQLATRNNVHLHDIVAVVCAGNTAMGHFLAAMPIDYIRRTPYVASSVELPPLRAAEVGIQINPRGLLYSLPGISGWVGSDLTCGILATSMDEAKEVCLLVDIGTNGEIIVGGKEWLVACSASAGPALEGASVECGMRAEEGAIEKVYVEDGEIKYATINEKPPKGLCGSGIIDIVAVLLNQKIINRSGKFTEGTEGIFEIDDIKAYTLVPAEDGAGGKPVFITEVDIENIIYAKGAIFAAMKIILSRLDLKFSDIKHFYLAGAFGSYINVENAITIGLIPELPRNRIEFAGNTSVWGAKLAAFYNEAFEKVAAIRQNTTYYDLMGAEDYVEEFQRAAFLPHTDIELFTSTSGK